MIELKPNESVTPASALHVPIGVASPLWFMFAGATTAGVAYWWMTRWMRPINLEALLPSPTADAPPLQAAAVLTQALVEPVFVAAAGVVDPDPAPIPAPEPAPNPLDTPPPLGAAAEPVIATVETVDAPDPVVVEADAPVLQAAPKVVAPAPKLVAVRPKATPQA